MIARARVQSARDAYAVSAVQRRRQAQQQIARLPRPAHKCCAQLPAPQSRVSAEQHDSAQPDIPYRQYGDSAPLEPCGACNSTQDAAAQRRRRVRHGVPLLTRRSLRCAILSSSDFAERQR